MVLVSGWDDCWTPPRGYVQGHTGGIIFLGWLGDILVSPGALVVGRRWSNLEILYEEEEYTCLVRGHGGKSLLWTFFLTVTMTADIPEQYLLYLSGRKNYQWAKCLVENPNNRKYKILNNFPYVSLLSWFYSNVTTVYKPKTYSSLFICSWLLTLQQKMLLAIESNPCYYTLIILKLHLHKGFWFKMIKYAILNSTHCTSLPSFNWELCCLYVTWEKETKVTGVLLLCLTIWHFLWKTRIMRHYTAQAVTILTSMPRTGKASKF